MTRFSFLASTLLSRLLGRQLQPPAPIEQPPATPRAALRAPQPKTEPMQAAEVIGTIDLAEHAHVYGRAAPTSETVKAAWLTLEAISLPVAGYVRACLANDQSLPIRSGNTDVDEWWLAVQKKAISSVTEVIAAIMTGVELKAWPALEDVMARDVDNGLRGAAARLTHLDGPAVRREVHIRDSRERVIVPRVYELGPDGPLVLPRDGGRISRVTVGRSAWVICDGWVGNAPPSTRSRRPNDGGGDRSSENTPPTPAGR